METDFEDRDRSVLDSAWFASGLAYGLRYHQSWMQ